MSAPSRLDIAVAGETLRLDAGRALYWERERLLVVADVHLGKGSVLRRAGVAVPSGSTQTDLQRLDALIDQHRAQRLLVLGDLFHGALAADEDWHAQVDAFRERHAGLAIDVVRGNHDRIDGVPARWRLHWHPTSLAIGPFRFVHDLADAAAEGPDAAAGHAIGGHVHPVFVLRHGRERLRLPVFRFGRRHSLLPAFGSFTGGYEIRPARDDRLIAIVADGLMPLVTVAD